MENAERQNGGDKKEGVLPEWILRKRDEAKRKELNDFDQSAVTLEDFEPKNEPAVENAEELLVEVDAEKTAETAEVAEAEKFLRENMAAIVEGVLNTTDDINQTENYIEGSNLDIRNQLGEKVKAIGDPQAEEILKARMKGEMAAYLKANEKAVAESAIQNAPTLASLFEVVKRYKEIKDGEKSFSREDLLATRENVLALEGRLDVYLNLGGENSGISEGDLRSMKGLIGKLTEGLPTTMNIKNEVEKRLQSKMSEVELYAVKAETTAKEEAPATPEEAPVKGGFFSKIKSGFSRLWGKK